MGSPALDRWATFDCYGTLIAWRGGISMELARLFGEQHAPRLLARYHELEPVVETEDPSRAYRDVMREVLARLAVEEGLVLPDADADALAESLPRWRPFPEVPAVLAELRRRGWKLALLSNTDADLLAASRAQLGVPIDANVVASEIGSYKPAFGHWERFFAETGADRARHVHVAQSHFHDVVPATALGLKTVWINRLGESAEPAPTRELRDLDLLPDTVDELVPA
jgi:2-haloacid dehalogenase